MSEFDVGLGDRRHPAIDLLASGLPACPSCLLQQHLMPALNEIIAAYNADKIKFDNNLLHTPFTHLLASITALAVHISSHTEDAHSTH